MPMSGARKGSPLPFRQALLHLQLLIVSGDMVNPATSDHGCRVILSDLATVVLFSKVSWRVARGMPPPLAPSCGPSPLSPKSYFGAVT